MELDDSTKDIALAFLRQKGIVPKEPVVIKNGRCSAHLYILNIQGKKKWITYQCFRPGCSHYVTLDGIRNRTAECINCGKHFQVVTERVVKAITGDKIEDRLHEKITCGCNLSSNELSKEITEKLLEQLGKEESKGEI